MPRLFDDDDLMTLLAGVGAETTALINGEQVQVCLTGRGSIQLTADGPMEVEQPYVLARGTDLAGLGLPPGDGLEGEAMTVDGQEYTILSVGPDRDGLRVVTLQETD